MRFSEYDFDLKIFGMQFSEDNFNLKNSEYSFQNMILIKKNRKAILEYDFNTKNRKTILECDFRKSRELLFFSRLSL